jgi:hypothetical protein
MPRDGHPLTPERMAGLAAVAKTKVKSSARGWSMLSRQEIVSLAFVADLILEDVTLAGALVAAPENPPISEL